MNERFVYLLNRGTSMTALNDCLPPDGFAPVSAASAEALAKSMDESGFGVLQHIVSNIKLAQLRSFVAHQIEQQGHAGNFHYDSYVVTVLLPVLIPSGPEESPGPPGHVPEQSDALVRLRKGIDTLNRTGNREGCL